MAEAPVVGTGPGHPFPDGVLLPTDLREPPARRRGSGRRVLVQARRHSVLLACLATGAVHLLSLTRRLGLDEGGYSMVARFWSAGGRYLYGPSWVDRPPLLIVTFGLAQHLGPYGVRLVAAGAAVALVATTAWAAEAVGGRTAAKWAAWVAFALGSSFLLGAQRLNGELLAATLVALAMAGSLRALHRSRTTLEAAAHGALAGVAAAAAVLVKQSVFDGLAFSGLLLLLTVVGPRTRSPGRRRRLVAMAAWLAASCAVLGTAWLWAGAHGGVRAWWFALFGFRAEAMAVMAHWSMAAPLLRLQHLGVVALITGVLPLLAQLGLRHLHRLRHLDPLPWALVAGAAVEVAGVLGGGNYWTHYLIALVPTVAVAAGLAAHRRMAGWRVTRGLVVATALVTAVFSPPMALADAGTPSSSYTVGRWLAASSRPTDTLFVSYSHANVVDESGLRPGYPYAWSLPLRTLDPHLHLLLTSLRANRVAAGDASAAERAAPAWVVQWDRSDTWGLDPHGSLRHALSAHYRRVAQVCGHPIWLHDGVRRSLAPLPPRSACGPGEG